MLGRADKNRVNEIIKTANAAVHPGRRQDAAQDQGDLGQLTPIHSLPCLRGEGVPDHAKVQVRTQQGTCDPRSDGTNVLKKDIVVPTTDIW